MKDKNLENLIKLCQDGNRHAFATLVKNYQQLVFNFLYRVIPKEWDVEDLAQEVWIKIYQSLNSLKNVSAFKSWLYRITVNTYYDRMRQKGLKVDLSLDEPIGTEDGDGVKFELVDPRALPEDILLEKEWQSNMEAAIKELPEQYRIVIIMREIDGLSYEEISGALDLSLGTVKSRIARARERLIQGLSEYFGKVKNNVP